MSMNIADGVLAATHKLVQQAMTGQWQEVPKTVEERRVLLDRLSASASSADQSWLSALKQAMAESDAAVAKMAGASAPTLTLPRGTGEGTEQSISRGLTQQASAPTLTQHASAPTLALPRGTGEGSGQIDGLMDMIRGERL
jgi:hypothetical protein